MTKKVLFVEQRPDHKYGVTEKGNSQCLSEEFLNHMNHL